METGADLRLERVDFDDVRDREFSDETIFQTKGWMEFVADAQNAEPVVAEARIDGRRVGRFTGLIVKKLGFRILGSPFPGWTTSYMGFNIDTSIPRFDFLPAVEKFAFEDLNCIHVEIMDRWLSAQDFTAAGYHHSILHGFEIDLMKDENTLFVAMDSDRRRCVRKAERDGVRIDVAEDPSFAEDYYEQLRDVFAKQGLVPTYSKDRVVSLMRHLLPTGRLLLVRARDQKGTCIGTGIFPAFNDLMYFWGGASWRQHQHLHPNEAIQWFAMRYWKARGIARYDMGGGSEYKRKYGGTEIAVPWGRKSKYSFLENLRTSGKTVARVRQSILGLKDRHSPYHHEKGQ